MEFSGIVEFSFSIKKLSDQARNILFSPEFSLMLFNLFLKFGVILAQNCKRVDCLFVINDKAEIVFNKIFIKNPDHLTMVIQRILRDIAATI